MKIDSTFLGLTVVTDIELNSGDLEETAELLRGCLAILRHQKGFHGAALHRCVDQPRWLLYAQWDTWDDWNDTLFSRQWEDGPGAQLWEQIAQQRLRLSPTVYSVMATA